MKKILIFGWLAILVLSARSNPLPIAELTRISAFPPGIEVLFNEFDGDTLYLSEFSIYTSQGTAAIDSGVYLVQDNDSIHYNITFDSSNTSGFAINHEADSIWLDIVIFGDTVFYEYIKFGSWYSFSPPIKGYSTTLNRYFADHHPQYDPSPWPYYSFNFANPDFGYTNIVINEINSHGTWANNSNYVELFNNSNEPVNLDGWKIVCDTIFDIPSDAVIAPLGFYVIDEDEFPSLFDMDYTADNIYLISPDSSCVGDTILIINGPRTVDQVGWSTDHGENISFIRYPDGDVDSSRWMDDFRGYDDATSTTFENGFPTRGAANRHNCPGFVVIGARADSLDDGIASIHWTDPIWDNEFDYSVLVSSSSGYPDTPEDGEIIYSGTGQQFIDNYITPSSAIFYTVFAHNSNGEYSTPTNESKTYIWFNAVGIEPENLPNKISAINSYPNPFNAQTTISFSLAGPGNVEISIYDITGRLVEPLTRQFYQAGKHSITWDANQYSSGIYFAKLAANETYKTERIVLLK